MYYFHHPMNTKKLHTPVVIIGAGPAGTSTSIFLSKAGVPHIILEKAVFPRDKVCGDGCSGKTTHVLRSANPAWLDEIYGLKETFLPCYGIQFIAPNGKGIDIPEKPDFKPGERPSGFVVPRLELDYFLFKKIDPAYATVMQNTTIESVTETPDAMVILARQNGGLYEIITPLVVGADGDKSLIRKQFLTEFVTPKTSAVGLRAYYDGVTGMHPESFLELHFLPEILPGYLWIFPLPNGRSNVGITILSKDVRAKKINLRETMLHALNTNPAMKKRFENATLVDKISGCGLPMCIDRMPVSGNRFLLTGDAAALIDPFSGEGIGNALFSGKLAAEAIVKAIAQQDYSKAFLAKNYDDVLFSKIGSELKISGIMQRLCRIPWLFNFVVNKAAKSPSLQKTISCMFSDLDMRAQLKKPSFYFKILMNR